MKPPSLDQTFKFPPDHCFTPDRIATEYRMLILGYVDQMNLLFRTESRVQEIRDCATRIYELTTALSAHELRTYFAPIKREENVSRETAEAARLEADQIPATGGTIDNTPNVSRETKPDDFTASTTEPGDVQ